MSVSFTGGPADGRELWLQRCPMFLRIVVDTTMPLKAGGKVRVGAIDALDLLEDTPKPGEEVHVYVANWTTPPVHICSRTNGCHWSASGSYRYLPDVDAQALGLGDTARWQEWAERHGNAALGIPDIRDLHEARALREVSP